MYIVWLSLVFLYWIIEFIIYALWFCVGSDSERTATGTETETERKMWQKMR